MKLLKLIFASTFIWSSWSFANENLVETTRYSARTHYQESLTLAQRHWRQVNFRKYQFQYQLSCFCRDTSPKLIVVENNRVVQVTDVVTGQPADRSSYAHHTIPALLNTLQSYVNRRPYRIQGSFDAVTGVPLFAWVDFNKRIADEETGFTISQFQQL